MLKSAVLASSFGSLPEHSVSSSAESNRAGTRAVHVNVRRILRIGDERVGVRAAARLDRRHLLRLFQVADIEDSNAAETLRADRGRDPLGAAVDPAARLLDRHEEQMTVDGHVTLSARTHDRRDEARALAVLDVVAVEAVEAAHEEMRSAEREIGIEEVHRVRRGGVVRGRRSRRLGRCRCLASTVRCSPVRRVGRSGTLGRRRRTGRRLGIEEAVRLRHAGDQLEVANRLTGVAQPGLQSDARVGVLLRRDNADQQQDRGSVGRDASDTEFHR